MAKSLLKSAAVVSGSIFSSRVLGLIRDVVIASLYGASARSDTFFVAFRIPNLLRRIFAEGAFNSAFVPAFSKKLKVSKEEAFSLAGEVLSFLLTALLITVLLGELLAPLIVKGVAPGFKGQAFAEAVRLLREMFPYVALISLVAFYGGVLNSVGHFFAPSFSTALFNLSVITAALLLSQKLSVDALSVGVIAGGALQLALVLFFAAKERALIRPKFALSEESRRVLKNLIPGIFGFAVRQLSMMIDTVMASFLLSGAISFLYYANRLIQLPLGMFAIGLSQVLLPRFSKAKKEEFKEEFSVSLRLCSAIIVPATVGLILFGKPILDAIYNHGAFGERALQATYAVLIGYGVGLLFFSLEKIVTNAFFSMEEFNAPVKISAFTLSFNALFNLLFAFGLKMGAAGLALGTSLTSLLNLLLLSRLLKERRGVDVTKELLRNSSRYLLLSIPVGVVALLGEKLYPYGGALLEKGAAIAVTVAAAAAVYGATLFIVKDPLLGLLKEA